MDGKQRWLKTNELSLGQYVAKVIKEHGKESDEFRGLVLIYGLDRLREAYREAKGLQKQSIDDGKSE